MSGFLPAILRIETGPHQRTWRLGHAESRESQSERARSWTTVEDDLALCSLALNRRHNGETRIRISVLDSESYLMVSLNLSYAIERASSSFSRALDTTMLSTTQNFSRSKLG